MSTGIIRVPKLFDPLQELQILHVLQLDQPVNWDVLVDAVLGEAGLEDFEVGDVLEFLVGVELDLVQRNIAYKNRRLGREIPLTIIP